MEQEKVLVLGAASWLGFLLLNKLALSEPSFALGGTLHNLDVDFTSPVKKFKPVDLSDYQQVIDDYDPDVIVNFLRGEDEQGAGIHQYCITHIAKKSGYYVYASSVLALDGYSGVPLTEDLKANGISEYGAFKAACEETLQASSINWCALRFASLQGWVPHRITRNEGLLKKLKDGQTITVDRGVVQNRMLASHMIDGVAALIEKRVTGIIHFGTTDSSEEYTFLQDQAKLFGYPTELIVGGATRDVNLVAIPKRIYEVLGHNFMTTQQDTLQGILQIPELRKYIKH
ncbi:hypothetical protein ACFQZI_03255 [Mucilaginibacter lutimaris]|uniref:dTDP-4-dehydrorhamnose reductase n=1 Tax=Mucilaginibacter lutimaris TaxID=931629 RepID=A0ABW2ZC77_9SPHI